ncbi:MAG: hypothetical protein JXR70_05815 [Spirochaetales bacterium]|nr:hypothetical protein [Spirochaetales bacterium]
MKQLFSFIITLLLLVNFLYGLDDSALLDSYIRIFDEASLDTKVRILEMAGDETSISMGQFYVHALDFLIAEQAVTRTTPLGREIGRIALREILDRDYSVANQIVWQVFEVSDDSILRIQAMETLAVLAKNDEQSINKINRYLRDQVSFFRNHEVLDQRVVFSAIDALARLGSDSSFEYLLEAAVIGLPDVLSQSAGKALFELASSAYTLFSQYLDRAQPQEIILAFDFICTTKNLAEKEVKDLAYQVFEIAAHTAAMGVKETRELRNLRYKACEKLIELKWNDDVFLAVEHFKATKLEYETQKIPISSNRPMVDAITLLGLFKDKKAAATLVEYLMVTNRKTDREKPAEAQLVLATVKSLGEIGDISAMDALNYTRFLPYDEKIIKAARDAILMLK